MANQATFKAFVLVHGAWHGGWCWRRVADLLTEAGHFVFTPTLTGLGERSHLIDASINLSTHIADVVNVLKWERLRDVVLCGHSYGGFVISGVAEKMEAAIASIVFVDAHLPENGDTVATSTTSPTRDRILEAASKGEVTVAPTPAAVFLVNENDRAWVDGLCVPHPLATLTERIVLTGARERIAKKLYVRAKGYASPAFDAALAKVCERPSWNAFELACGHDIMVDMPSALAEILLERT
jgi:pimeloyl-ACP methyl ester carboxylesterase